MSGRLRAASMALWVSLSAAGCEEPHVLVEVRARPTMYPATALRVTARDEGGAEATQMFALPDERFPKTLVVATDGRSGDIEIAIDAVDQDNLLVGRSRPAHVAAGGDQSWLMLEPADVMANWAVEGFQQTQPAGFPWTARHVAVNDAGEIAVVWESGGQVMMRLFGEDARPLATSAGSTAELVLNDPGALAGDTSVVAGEQMFMVVWLDIDEGSVGDSSVGDSVRARIFDRDAVLTQNIDSPALTISPGPARAPNAAALVSGGYVVVWEDPDSRELRGVLLDEGGTPSETSFPVAAARPADSEDAFPRCTGLVGGGFACGWLRAGPTGMSVVARAFDPAATPAGAERPVEEEVAFGSVGLASTPGGGFVVAWQRWGAPASAEAMLQRFTADATPVAAPVRVATLRGEAEEGIDVAVRATDGAISVLWSDGDFIAGTLDIYARQLHPDGLPAGPQVLAATTTDANQRDPSVAARTIDGAIVAVWTDESEVPPDDSGSGVRMRISYPVLDLDDGAIGARCGAGDIAPCAADLVCAPGYRGATLCHPRCEQDGACADGGVCVDGACVRTVPRTLRRPGPGSPRR